MDQNPLNPPKPPERSTPPPNLPRPPVPVNPQSAPVQPTPPRPSGPGITVRISEPPVSQPQTPTPPPPVQSRAPQPPVPSHQVSEGERNAQRQQAAGTQPPAPAPAPVIPPPIPRLAPQPATPPPKPIRVPTAPTEYRTAIRSMSDDIAKIKVGQQPTGTEVQKTITRAPEQTSAPTPIPGQQARLAQPSSNIRMSLGESKRASTLGSIPPAPGLSQAPRPLQQLPPPGTSDGRDNFSSGGSRTWFYLLVITLAILGIVIFLVASRDDDVAVETPTPLATETLRPTTTPSIGLQFAGAIESFILSETDPASDLANKVNAIVLNPGEVRKVIITTESKGSGDLSITDIMNTFGVAFPQTLEAVLGEDYITLVYGQKESYTATGQLKLDALVQKRLAFLTEITDLSNINQVVSSWEPTMPNSLASILGFDTAKAAGTGFADSAFNGINVRFRNFPHADHSIDYAIIKGTNGRTYLLIAGSRESAFGLLDRLR